MYRVYLIYALSGFVNLGYQVAWFRIYVDRFGSTNLTFALVVCNFIGGLGVGALASARLCRWFASVFRISDRLRLAVLQLRLGRARAAVETLRRFGRIEPNEEVGYRMLGSALGRQQQHGEAIRAIRRPVGLDPHSPDAHETLGNWLVSHGSLDEGIRHLREALALQPGREQTQRSLTIALQRQRSPNEKPDEAEKR